MYDAIWDAAAHHLSAERMLREAAEFYELARWSSFDRIAELARLVASRLSDSGAEDVRLIEQHADGRTFHGGWAMPRAYDVRSASLTLLGGDAPDVVLADYATNPTSLMMYSEPTPEDGFTGELIAADTPEAIGGPETRGRFVLTSGIGLEYGRAAAAAGALGLVSDCRAERRFVKEGTYLDATNEWHNYTIPPWDEPGKGRGFSISPAQGSTLREYLAAGETLRLRATVRSRHYDGSLALISARLPGLSPEEIALTGHYDEFGADDNCSQIAVALEVLRTIGSMVGAGQIPPLKRAVRVLLPMEVRGLNALTQDPVETRWLRAGLNIDTVGTDQNAGTAYLSLVETLPALPSCNEDLLADMLDRLSDGDPLFRWRQVRAEMIDNILGEPLVGAPTPALYHFSATHHLALDTPERLSGRTLFDMARVTTTYAAFLAGAGLSEAQWLAGLSAARGARLMSVAACSSSNGARRLHALHDRARRKLGSAAWLVPPDDLMPAVETFATGTPSLVGPDRLVPSEAYAAHAASLAGRVDSALRDAEASAETAAAAAGKPLAHLEMADGPSTCVPEKAFRGYLAFEDLDDDARATLAELGIEEGWGAPMWLQNALMLADGARTVGEIADALRPHNGIIDVERLEAVCRFLAERGRVRLRPYLTRSQVADAVRQAGIAEGDCVLAHFSLRRFGYVEGGAEAMAGAVLDAIGTSGTLLAPAFTWSWVGHPPFDRGATPSRVGAVTEHLRQRPGTLRSNHPTHSFTAVGPRAEELLQAHLPDLSPLGVESPMARLAALGGKVLMLAPLGANTSMHLGELRGGIPLPDFLCQVVVGGERREVVTPACPWHALFGPAYELMVARAQIVDVTLGEETLHAMLCSDAIAAQEEVARRNPELLQVPGCECVACRRLRAWCDDRR